MHLEEFVKTSFQIGLFQCNLKIKAKFHTAWILATWNFDLKSRVRIWYASFITSIYKLSYTYFQTSNQQADTDFYNNNWKIIRDLLNLLLCADFFWKSKKKKFEIVTKN